MGDQIVDRRSSNDLYSTRRSFVISILSSNPYQEGPEYSKYIKLDTNFQRLETI